LDGRRPVGPTLWAVPNFRVGVGANMPSQGIKNPVTDLDNYWEKSPLITKVVVKVASNRTAMIRRYKS
jgi:hypothetical protein